MGIHNISSQLVLIHVFISYVLNISALRIITHPEEIIINQYSEKMLLSNTELNKYYP